MLGQSFNLRLDRTALYGCGDAILHVSGQQDIRAHMCTHDFVFRTAQNRGETGSIIFLFDAQMESHSSDTMA